MIKMNEKKRKIVLFLELSVNSALCNRVYLYKRNQITTAGDRVLEDAR